MIQNSPPIASQTTVPASSGVPTSAAPLVIDRKRVVGTPWYAQWIVAFIAWGIGTVLLFVFLPDSSWFAWRQIISKYILRSEYITLTSTSFEQNRYIVSHVKVNKPGYLILFTGNNYDLGLRSPVAQSTLLLPGEYTNVQLRAPKERMDEEDPASFIPGSTMYVSLFHDDGDGAFAIDNKNSLDKIAHDPLGHPIFVKLTLR